MCLAAADVTARAQPVPSILTMMQVPSFALAMTRSSHTIALLMWLTHAHDPQRKSLATAAHAIVPPEHEADRQSNAHSLSRDRLLIAPTSGSKLTADQGALR